MRKSAPPPEDTDELTGLLHFVARAAIDNRSTDEFLRAFQADAGTIAPTMFGAIDDPSARRALIGQFGRAFWSTIPRPQQNWRAVPVPKPERNGPCPCGSGKKFKACCQPYDAPPEMFPQLNMLRFVLDLWPNAKLTDIPLRKIDPDALADAVNQWVNEGDHERGIRMLERLFDNAAQLDERHLSCFDALCDAYVEAGMQPERERFVARLTKHSNVYLASTALQRGTTLATDEGDFKSAWEQFGRAMRLTPDDPSLAPLEVLVLSSEGRVDEAKARAAVWAARLRRMDRPDFEDLIEFLEATAVDPDRAMLKVAERNRPGEGAWSELLDAAPITELLYEIECNPSTDDRWGPGRMAIAMKPKRALAAVEREWRNQFFVRKPDLVYLDGDGSSGCEAFAAIVQFMRDHPAAWQSFAILDDLVLIARDWFDEEEVAFGQAAVILALTKHAVELLEKCVATSGEAAPIIAWTMLENRPALRLVAQRIDASLDSLDSADDEREVDRLQAWLLELNPNDNHGYRDPLMKSHLLSGDIEHALALAARYPEGAGDMSFDLALALFRAGRRDEAAEAWRRGAESTPLIAATLLAARPRAPQADDRADDRYEVFGGPEHAWRYRMQMREVWTASGALAWAKTLPRVPVPKFRKPSPLEDRSPSPGPVGFDPSRLPDEAVSLRALADHGFAVTTLHGVVTAVVLSPAMIMPTQWLTIALESRANKSAGSIDEINATLQPLMGLYNSINSALRMSRGDGYVPSTDLMTSDPAQAMQWARGFMRIVEQGRAAWQHMTSKPRGKAALSAIERAAAGMVSDDQLRQAAAALGVADSLSGDATWYDVLAAATRELAAA